MTSPTARGPADPPREPRLSAFFSPIVEESSHDDGLTTSQQLEVQLERDQGAARRAVIVTQRLPRITIASALALVSLVVGRNGPPIAALVSVLIVYAGVVFGLPLFLRDEQSRPLRDPEWLAPAILTADLLAIGFIFWLTQVTRGTHSFLVAGLLIVWVAGFYFTDRLAVYGALLSAAIYLVIGRAGVAGGTPWPDAVVDLTIFAAFAGILVYQLSRFREHVSQVHLFCRQVGDGDVGLRLPTAIAHAPDEITALAQSVDAMRKRLAEQIGVDALTGCLNRRALESRLRGEWRLAKRRRGRLVVLAVDLDHFKDVNDIHGHQVGDTVLQQFAGIMRAVARESDVVARLGGDEFIMILPDTDSVGAQILAERLRRRVAEFAFGSAASPVRMTISVGAALAEGAREISPDEIVAEADRNLYLSKEQGRNRVSLGM